jgi:hypothetical protein
MINTMNVYKVHYQLVSVQGGSVWVKAIDPETAEAVAREVVNGRGVDENERVVKFHNAAEEDPDVDVDILDAELATEEDE